MKSEVKHYEHIWEEAEKNSKEENSLFVLDNINSLISDYKDISEASTDEKTKSIFKFRKFGEILFALCELSKIDNINVYTALKQEIDIKAAK
jgi:hypothetical protein